MKKLLLLLAFALSASSTVFAEEVQIDGLWYNLSETTAEVIKYKNNVRYSGNIVIPETVTYNDTEYSVTSIGESAFGNCSSMTSVSIPNSVTSIGERAFKNCTDLTSITIPNSVTTIGIEVFNHCSSLISIIVEEGNTKYDSRNNCNAIIVTSSNTLIAGCKNTTIPNSVTTIGILAFSGCSGLTSITIPNSVTIIGDYVFNDCSGLTSIVVEEGNTKYDSRNNCNAIIETLSNTLIAGCKNTIIPNSVTSLGNDAFYGCNGLLFITIPNSVTSIGERALYSCTSLTPITIPNSVTTIGIYAFYSCTSLTSITIPNSVTSIGENAFLGCRGLTAIIVEEGNSNYDSRNNCNAIIETSSNTLIAGCKNTIIPNSVTKIGDSAFDECWELTSIAIPNSVTTIGNAAFYYCRSLKDVYCFAETIASISSNAFYVTPISNVTLHVPASSVDAYNETEPWSSFKDVVALSSIEVPNQKIGLDGTTTVEIGLNNYETNFVAFQMDLTLPEGVSIDKTGCSLSSRITDEDQELTIGKLESGAYRITSTSLSLTPISGNDGTLLTLKLTAAENYEGGQATISNIRFSTSNSAKVVMSDETFDIDILKKYKLKYIVDGQEYSTEEVKETTPLTAADEPTREGYTFGGWSEVPETMPDHDVVITGRFYLFGDVNTDEEVDVVDVVDIARFVVATPSANFREKLADLNKDLTVNIADAVVLVNHIAGDQEFAMAPSVASYDYNQCKLQLLSNGTNTLSLCLNGDADFTAFQFDVELPENTDITAIKINGQRMSGHQLLYNKVGDNCYRVAALSLSNAVFKGREGELLNISIDGLVTDGISIRDIHFVTKAAIDVNFDTISHCETTGIDNINASEDYNEVYDLQGRKLSKAQRGTNIIRSAGGRMQVKKVFVNR